MQKTSRAHWVLLIACIGTGCEVKLPKNPNCAVTTDCPKGQWCDVADGICSDERTENEDAAISDEEGSDAAVDAGVAGATGAAGAPMSDAGNTGSDMLAIDDSRLWMSNSYGSPNAGNYAYQLDCDADQLLVGLHVETQTSTGALLGLGAFCGHPTLTQNSAGQFVLGHADDRLIAVYGNDQTTEPTDSLDFGCKSDETITSLSLIEGDVVLAPVKYTKTVTQIEIACSRGVLNTASTFAFVASRVLSSNMSHPALTGVRTDISCPSGQVVVDLRGKSGAAIDALGIVCAPLSLGVSAVR